MLAGLVGKPAVPVMVTLFPLPQPFLFLETFGLLNLLALLGLTILLQPGSAPRQRITIDPLRRLPHPLGKAASRIQGLTPLRLVLALTLAGLPCRAQPGRKVLSLIGTVA